MPQGALNLLPLHAAWRPADGVPRAFLDDWTVTFAPSAYALYASHRRLQASPPRQRTMLSVVNPTGDLDYALIEGALVAALFPPGERRALAGEEATLEAVLDGTAGRAYLHFTTHGYYDWFNPVDSGLLLSGRTVLTLSHFLAGIDLGGVRLATLSACETGLTDARHLPGEYVGLPAGFLQAGVPGIVSSLWAVDDLATALLIECFYKRHLAGAEPAAALRSAQLWVRDVTAGELVERFAAERGRTDPDRPLTDEQASVLWRWCAAFRPSERPFRPHYYWAAFVWSGV